MDNTLKKEGLDALQPYLRNIDAKKLAQEFKLRQERMGGDPNDPDPWEDLPPRTEPYKRIIWGSAGLQISDKDFLAQWRAVVWVAQLFDLGWLSKNQNPHRHFERAVMGALRAGDISLLPDTAFLDPELAKLLPRSLVMPRQEALDFDERLNYIIHAYSVVPSGQMVPARQIIEDKLEALITYWSGWAPGKSMGQRSPTISFAGHDPSTILLRLALRNHHLPEGACLDPKEQAFREYHILIDGVLEGDPSPALRWLKDKFVPGDVSRVAQIRENHGVELVFQC